MSVLQTTIQQLEQGTTLRHQVPREGLNIVIYPPDKEGEKERPSAWIHIGDRGSGGASLAFTFEDNEAAAYFFLGFQGITEVVEM